MRSIRAAVTSGWPWSVELDKPVPMQPTELACSLADALEARGISYAIGGDIERILLTNQESLDHDEIRATFCAWYPATDERLSRLQAMREAARRT